METIQRKPLHILLQEAISKIEKQNEDINLLKSELSELKEVQSTQVDSMLDYIMS
jgi:hypothetical protein